MTRADAWIHFAVGAAADDMSPSEASLMADKLLVELDKRFQAANPTGYDVESTFFASGDHLIEPKKGSRP
jgi:hypothetical protein